MSEHGDKAEAEDLSGLFDLRTFAEMVEAIAQVLSLPRDTIRERLFREAVDLGWNVSRAASAAGVTPHVFDDRMAAFYRETDAFVFELAAVQSTPYCRVVDRRVTAIVQTHAGGPAARVLVYGDGIGSDALRLARLGYPVTYAEFEGWSAAFARHRFARAAWGGRIAVCEDPARIPREAFDVVVCREVLEHVPDPPALVAVLRSSLARDGIAVVAESFGMVSPAFPTHLASNLVYVGRTAALFESAGFDLVERAPDDKPMVFRNTARAPRLLPPPPRTPVRDFLRAAGRRVLGGLPF